MPTKKVKSAFVLAEKAGSIISEGMWDDLQTAVPRAIKVAGKEAVFFVGHSHTPTQKRSVFQMHDGSTIPQDFLEAVVRDNLAPIGHVQYVSETEYDIAKHCSSAPNPDHDHNFQEGNAD